MKSHLCITPSVITPSSAWKGYAHHLWMLIIGAEAGCIIAALLNEASITTRIFTLSHVIIGVALLMVAVACRSIGRFRTPSAPGTSFFYTVRKSRDSIFIWPLKSDETQQHLLDGALLKLQPEMILYFTVPTEFQKFVPAPHFQLKAEFFDKKIKPWVAEQFMKWIDELALNLEPKFTHRPPTKPGEELAGWEKALAEGVQTKSSLFMISDVKAIQRRPDLG